MPTELTVANRYEEEEGSRTSSSTRVYSCQGGMVVATVIGIHGIGQQQSGRHQLLPSWRQATLDGLERATGRRQEPPLSLDLAFYGDLFLKSGTKAGGKGARIDLAEEPLTEREGSEFESAIVEALGHPTLADQEEDPASKGFTQAPAPLRALIRTVDRMLGAGAGVLLLGVFRQVTVYLRDAEVKRQIDDRVAAAVQDDTKIIIGHSLGSVVAFEYMRSAAPEDTTLITIGSPLGFSFARKLLPDTVLPAPFTQVTDTARWANVRDPRDPVACAGDLRTWWPQSADAQVHNGSDAHSATKYLGKAATGAAIVSMLKEYSGDGSESGRRDPTALLRGRSDEHV